MLIFKGFVTQMYTCHMGAGFSGFVVRDKVTYVVSGGDIGYGDAHLLYKLAHTWKWRRSMCFTLW